MKTPRGIWNWAIIIGIVGLLVTIIGVVVTLRYERRPGLTVEVIGESDVLDVRRPLEDLVVEFGGEDIERTNRNLRVVTVRISNAGSADILQNQYDRATTRHLVRNTGELPSPIDTLLSVNSAAA